MTITDRGERDILESEMLEGDRLPPDISKAIEEFEEGVRSHSPLLDCLWGELYGAINANQWSGIITAEFADRLRRRYLFNYGEENGTDRLQRMREK